MYIMPKTYKHDLLHIYIYNHTSS